MDDKERKYWVAFTRIPQIGRARIKLMEAHFGTLQSAWSAGLTELKAAGLDISMVSSSLAMMELSGLVRQVGGMNYIRLKESSAQYQAV